MRTDSGPGIAVPPSLLDSPYPSQKRSAQAAGSYEFSVRGRHVRVRCPLPAVHFSQAGPGQFSRALKIAVSVKVGEGLVMAADSMSSYAEAGSYTVRGIAEQLHGFIRGKYDAAFPLPSVLPLTIEPVPGDGQPAAAPESGEAVDEGLPVPAPGLRPPLGVVIGGYSRREFFPDEFEFLLPSGAPSEIWPDPDDGRQQYGVRWWGQTRPIERLYLGCDTAAIDWFVDNGVAATDAVQYYTQLRDRLMWPIIYQGMPIQDAIDLAVYLVNVTIGHSRFAVGPPVCGGHIDVATVTSRGFRWVRRKDWVVKTDSVFF